MFTIEMSLFVLALVVAVGAYGASVWSSIKPTQKPKKTSAPPIH
jgi:hypothetical protein